MEKIEILFKKKDWIIVNKPPGLSVHNNEDETNLLKVLEEQGFPDLSPINRIDKETSGIILLGSSSSVCAKIQTILQDKTTIKTYLGILRGSLSKGESKGRWDVDLTNKAEGRKNPLGVKKERVKCITNYEVLNENKYLSFVKFTIETGRQHQIRKHAVLDKHQVIGDSRYGDKKYNNMISKKYSFSNMALHSAGIEFVLDKEKVSIHVNPPSHWAKIFNLNQND